MILTGWVCRCGAHGDETDADRAAGKWHVHARRKGCTTISRQALVDAMSGQQMLSAEEWAMSRG